MTPTRRTRKPGPKKSKVTRTVLESSEEDSSDAGSVTRCICGESHNSGLMVQCDKCEVWQHCECIGLIQEKLPDHYYCDQCEPAHHQYIKTANGRSKRLYNATISSSSWSNNNSTVKAGVNSDSDTTSKSINSSSPASKRRKTTSRNRPSRSPTQSQKKEPNTPKLTNNELIPSSESNSMESIVTTSSILISSVTEQLSSLPLAKIEEEVEDISNTNNESDSTGGVIEERLTRSRRSNTTTPSSSIKNNKIPADGTDISPQDIIEEATVATPRKRNGTKRTVSSSPSPYTTTQEKRSNSKHHYSNNKTHSQNHHSQVVYMDDYNGTPPPYWNYTDGKPTRESSPPAKVKYPHSKMTFSDMNRRAKQIMNCISKMQVEEMKKRRPSSMDNDEFFSSLQRPRSLSTSSSSSSLSSASTVPLLDDYTTTTTSASSSPSTPLPFTPKEKETSFEILERVNRELIKFQRKFGIAYQQSNTTTIAATTRASPNRSCK